MKGRITGSMLVNLVKGRTFRSNLAEAAKTTLSNGNETGFRLCREVSTGKDYFSPVVEVSQCDILDDDAYEEWGEKQFPYWITGGDIYNYFDLHFHPDCDLKSCLLVNDVADIFSKKGPAVKAVATVSSDDRRGRILLMQWKSYMPLWESHQYWEPFAEDMFEHYKSICDHWPQPDFAQLLETDTVRADELRFSISSKSTMAKVANPEIMTRFAHNYAIDDEPY